MLVKGAPADQTLDWSVKLVVSLVIWGFPSFTVVWARDMSSHMKTLRYLTTTHFLCDAETDPCCSHKCPNIQFKQDICQGGGVQVICNVSIYPPEKFNISFLYVLSTRGKQIAGDALHVRWTKVIPFFNQMSNSIKNCYSTVLFP